MRSHFDHDVALLLMACAVDCIMQSFQLALQLPWISKAVLDTGDFGCTSSACVDEVRMQGDTLSARHAFLAAFIQASTWEKTAALNEEQLKVVELLSDCCSQRPYPAHVSGVR